MKPHRIFIAINLPEDVKKQLLAYKNNWPELPARWTTEENLHLTLAFLGNTSDQELGEVYKVMQEVGARHEPFSMVFTNVVYGPLKTTPRMIWVVGEISSELAALQKDVETSLARSEDPSTSLRTRQPFSLHLTLARLNAFQFHQMETEELPDVNEEISLSFEVTSVEVMESQLRRSGAQYTILQSFMLKQ